MKNTIYISLMLLLFSCNNQSPKTTPEISEQEREKLLQEKKAKLSETKGEANGNIDASTIEWGDIRFTPFVPPYPELGNEGIGLVENKINSLVSKYGITGNVGNPGFIIIPAINITSKNVTSTAPTMYANTYSVTFYTASLSDGTIFSSADFSFKGVGESPLKAFINGLESSKIDEGKFKKLLTDGKEKALKYYETHCESILQEAKNEAAQKRFDEAILILKTIPKETECYKKTGDLIEKYFNSNMAENCNDLLAKMKAELGKQSDIGGYNEQAMAYYALIPANAPCYKEGQNTYNNYLKKLEPKAKQQWEKEEREFNLRKDKQEQDHTYDMTKADLEAKVAIDGQTALLQKYKKDYEYEKLPWLRKLVHLGEWDPFDATSKVNR